MDTWKIKYLNKSREVIATERFVGTYSEARIHAANRVYTDDTIWGCVTEFLN